LTPENTTLFLKESAFLLKTEDFASIHFTRSPFSHIPYLLLPFELVNLASPCYFPLSHMPS